jgi:hypothetical protein
MVSALAGGLLRFFVQGSNLPQELIVLVLGRTLPVRRLTEHLQARLMNRGAWRTTVNSIAFVSA